MSVLVGHLHEKKKKSILLTSTKLLKSILHTYQSGFSPFVSTILLYISMWAQQSISTNSYNETVECTLEQYLQWDLYYTTQKKRVINLHHDLFRLWQPSVFPLFLLFYFLNSVAFNNALLLCSFSEVNLQTDNSTKLPCIAVSRERRSSWRHLQPLCPKLHHWHQLCGHTMTEHSKGHLPGRRRPSASVLSTWIKIKHITIMHL